MKERRQRRGHEGENKTPMEVVIERKVLTHDQILHESSVRQRLQGNIASGKKRNRGCPCFNQWTTLYSNRQPFY